MLTVSKYNSKNCTDVHNKIFRKKKLNQYITNSKLQDFILLEDLKSNTHNVYVGCKYQIVEK